MVSNDSNGQVYPILKCKHKSISLDKTKTYQLLVETSEGFKPTSMRGYIRRTAPSSLLRRGIIIL